MERSRSIVIIDDEPSVLRIIQVALGGEGMATRTAPDGEAGLELLSAEKPDYLIVDVRLPGIDGLEVARRVKSDPNLASIQILMISAYGEPQGHVADAFLGKPFDIDQLIEKVNALGAAQQNGGPVSVGA